VGHQPVAWDSSIRVGQPDVVFNLTGLTIKFDAVHIRRLVATDQVG
jgi:hypothetical protein